MHTIGRHRPAAAIAVISVLAIGAGLLAATAPATPPGTNGRIAFTRYDSASRTSGAIFTVAANGRGERRLTQPPQGVADVQPDWSRDGTRLVFERQYRDKPYEIFTIGYNRSDLRQLDPGCPPGVPRTQVCEELEPALASDGTRVAFSWAYGGLKQIRGQEWIEVAAITLIGIDGSHVRQLTQLERPTTSEDRQPVFSPDGKHIAFIRQNSTARPYDGKAIFTINADGSGERRLTPWKLDAGDHPDWSPDGRRILFRAPDNDEFFGSNLYTVRTDGTGLRKLTGFGPDAGVTSASFSPDGKWAAFGSVRQDRLPDLYAIRIDGSGLRRITRTDPWESGPDWGPAA